MREMCGESRSRIRKARYCSTYRLPRALSVLFFCHSARPLVLLPHCLRTTLSSSKGRNRRRYALRVPVDRGPVAVTRYPLAVARTRTRTRRRVPRLAVPPEPFPDTRDPFPLTAEILVT